MFKNIINKITESLAVWDFIAKFRAVSLLPLNVTR